MYKADFSECLKSTDTSGPEIVRPTGKKEGVLDGMKSLKIDQNNVPDWMKPNEDLLKKVNADKELASAVNNAKLTKAIDEVIACVCVCACVFCVCVFVLIGKPLVTQMLIL